MHDTRSPDSWFAPLASVLIISATAGVSAYVFRQAQEGVFHWWPYPAFAVLVGAVFWTYALVSRRSA